MKHKERCIANDCIAGSKIHSVRRACTRQVLRREVSRLCYADCLYVSVIGVVMLFPIDQCSEAHAA